MRVHVLRLGHRPLRDKRITTHVGLVARALGAVGMAITVEDDNIKASVEKVVREWGGEFYIKVVKDWKSYIRGWAGQVVHLTMYGLPLEEVVSKLQDSRDELNLLIVVGAEKVPGEVFEMADYNVSVTNQPHSEVAALALLLDRIFQGKELAKQFGGRRRIVPSARSKQVSG